MPSGLAKFFFSSLAYDILGLNDHIAYCLAWVRLGQVRLGQVRGMGFLKIINFVTFCSV